MPNTNRRGGRILAHERLTNDDQAILGADLHIQNYNEDVHQTLTHEISDNTRKDYRRRILRIIKYWKNIFPDYYNIGVKQVTEAELNDPSK